MITVYDLGPGKIPSHLGLSQHVRKTIFTLNYKRIPFKIVNITLDEVESTAKSVGAPPSTKNPDGSPKYTVPFIHDSTTGKVVTESFLIAEYLDEAYPDTPKVIPPGTRALQHVFAETSSGKLLPLVPLYIPRIVDFSAPGMVEMALRRFGPPPSPPTDEQREEMWKTAEDGFNELTSAYGDKEGIFVMGEKPVFADLALAALIATIKVSFGDESEEWKRASGWIGGRAGKLVDEVIKYERVSA
ncbi:hypothetical protein V5O48_017706 [Marasmius crinis-equi]|uniref:GST N-terminal domain-containing protein n=1 Tax=Marasmius crinis-equi TaxID=585013 RepID=A0ABR3EN72_9AGAR